MKQKLASFGLFPNTGGHKNATGSYICLGFETIQKWMEQRIALITTGVYGIAYMGEKCFNQRLDKALDKAAQNIQHMSEALISF